MLQLLAITHICPGYKSLDYKFMCSTCGLLPSVQFSNSTQSAMLQFKFAISSTGGNLLMNVGPTHDGRIVPIFEERLRQMGSWLNVNGESIYSTVPWPKCQNDTVTPNVW